MQQRQLRLGDILDDYCPRERRVTNHAVVAMVGEDVKQTRCTTCDAEHEYKHAKVPRQRRKGEAPAALYAQVAASAPKRVSHETSASDPVHANEVADEEVAAQASGSPDADLPGDDAPMHAADAAEPAELSEPSEPADDRDEGSEDEEMGQDTDDGPIHRRLIRASLPRPEGQQPPARPIPEFTIRQPGGRPNRFRPRHQRGGQPGGHQFQGNRATGNVAGPRGQRPGGGGRPGMMKRHGPPGRKRSK